MGLKEKLKELKAKAEEMKQRGRIITEQQRAEKLRRKSNKISSMKPGAHRAIVEGIAMKQKQEVSWKEQGLWRQGLIHGGLICHCCHKKLFLSF